MIHPCLFYRIIPQDCLGVYRLLDSLSCYIALLHLLLGLDNFNLIILINTWSFVTPCNYQNSSTTNLSSINSQKSCKCTYTQNIHVHFKKVLKSSFFFRNEVQFHLERINGQVWLFFQKLKDELSQTFALILLHMELWFSVAAELYQTAGVYWAKKLNIYGV